MGQELLDAAILLAAVVMLGWHNVWMSRTGATWPWALTPGVGGARWGEAALGAGHRGRARGAARRLRIVLFLYGITPAGAGGGSVAMVIGGALGLAAGAAAGTTIYLGLVSIPLRYLFTVTSWLVLLLAAGMASQGAGVSDAGGSRAPARQQPVGHLVPVERNTVSPAGFCTR